MELQKLTVIRSVIFKQRLNTEMLPKSFALGADIFIIELWDGIETKAKNNVWGNTLIALKSTNF